VIRIARGPEPTVLPQLRANECARVRALLLSGKSVSDVVGNAYAVVKSALWEQQAKRCCYCERAALECAYNDVEHFRPKARADRLNGDVHTGYWWLAWTWENLLFCCPSCNRSAKNDAFPLEPGCVPLMAEEQPPSQERPSLIDPCAEDPVELIQFVFDGYHWQPVGRNGSSRGQRTVEVLQLGRPELLSLYGDHVRDFVRPETDGLNEAIAREDAADIERKWRRIVRWLLAPRMPFVALSFDAILHLVPESDRVRWDLELPWPPVRGP